MDSFEGQAWYWWCLLLGVKLQSIGFKYVKVYLIYSSLLLVLIGQHNPNLFPIPTYRCTER
jgi:hypothetical protein